MSTEITKQMAFELVREDNSSGPSINQRYFSNVEKTADGSKCQIYSNTVLQGLDQYLTQNDGSKCFYPKEAFKQTVKDWVGTNVVFADDHPELGKVGKGGEIRNKALGKVNGKVVGTVKSAEVIEKNTGKPYIKIEMNVCHPDANGAFENGQLGISSAFTCSTIKSENGDETIVGNIKPDHVLLFRRNPMAGSEQRDAAAIVNKSMVNGGPGSGDFGHEGRPGEVGGSGSGGSYKSYKTTRSYVKKTEEGSGRSYAQAADQHTKDVADAMRKMDNGYTGGRSDLSKEAAKGKISDENKQAAELLDKTISEETVPKGEGYMRTGKAYASKIADAKEGDTIPAPDKGYGQWATGTWGYPNEAGQAASNAGQRTVLRMESDGTLPGAVGDGHLMGETLGKDSFGGGSSNMDENMAGHFFTQRNAGGYEVTGVEQRGGTRIVTVRPTSGKKNTLQSSMEEPTDDIGAMNMATKTNTGKEFSDKNRGMLQEVHGHLKAAADKLGEALTRAQGLPDMDTVPSDSKPDKVPDQIKKNEVVVEKGKPDNADKPQPGLKEEDPAKFPKHSNKRKEESQPSMPHVDAGNDEKSPEAKAGEQEAQDLQDTHLESLDEETTNKAKTDEELGEDDMKELENLKAQMNTIQGELKTKIEALEKEKAEMTAQLNKVAAEKNEAELKAFVNNVKPGLVDTVEKQNSLFAEYKKDPLAFMAAHKDDLSIGGTTNMEGSRVAAVKDNQGMANMNAMPHDKVLSYNARSRQFELI